MSGDRPLTSSGQPAMIVSTSWFSTASSDVSRLTLSSRSVEKRTRSTRRSRSMVVTLSGLGNHDKPSASWFCEPGRCVFVKLYPCNWINIRCSLGGADAMGLLVIAALQISGPRELRRDMLFSVVTGLIIKPL